MQAQLETRSLARELKPERSGSVLQSYVLFFFSGVRPLLYQIVWQRALFTIYGLYIESERQRIIPLRAGLILASIVGLIALSYEMIWYRLYSFASGRSAATFTLLLAWYLAGVAYGSFAVRDLCRGRLRSDMRAV